ncbi:MAG: putative RNA-binding protein with RPS1 domain [Bacillariaceae sp.]|jgi:predicted RNA-binding protein with RPS1 domain
MAECNNNNQKQRRCCIILLQLTLFVSCCTCFIIPPANVISSKSKSTLRLLSTTKDTEESVTEKLLAIDNSNNNESSPKKCFWKPSRSNTKWWQERKLLDELKVGQELSGCYLVEDLLTGNTGPKLFFECGIGRINPKSGNWSISNGMLRLSREKISVSRKRTARFRKKNNITLYVSRIQKECGRFEVCATLEDVKKYTSITPKISVTSLKNGQVVTGEVVKLYPYGAIIDIGANRRGLLHITKVAKLMNKCINKEKGLINSGLEKGAKVRLMVESIEKRRLSLDFTDDVKEDARKELEMDAAQKNDNNKIDDDELASWAEFAANQELAQYEVEDDDDEDDDDDDDDEEDNDVYDEDRDIESAFGLDSY